MILYDHHQPKPMAPYQLPSNPEGPAPPPDLPVERQAPICIVGKRDDPTRRGRTIIATRKMESGEVIFVSTPNAYPASFSSICVFCSNCYGDLPSEPLRCTTCNVARFCSDQCLQFSHPTLLCNTLPLLLSRSVDPTSPEDLWPEDCLFISGDYKWNPDLLYLLCVYSFHPSLLLEFISFPTNLTFIPDDALVGTLHSQLTSLIRPDLIPRHFSPEITSYLLSNKKNHSFPRALSPKHPQFDVCGVNGVHAYAIHMLLSGVNHECLPNVCVFNFFDPLVQNHVKIFRALHEIDKATEISVCYLPLNTEYRDRQRILMEHHGFSCDCMRCDIESQWKEEQDEESGRRRRRKRREKRKKEKQEKKGRGGRGIGGAEEEVPEAAGNWCPYSKFLKRHVCDCGGCLAPFPPSDDRTRQNLMECNICGVVRNDKHVVAEDIREDEKAVAKDVREDEQAVAKDVGELMRKLLPKMSEEMSELLLKMLR